tara:strand:+ start:1788 stop:2219 length:432 start_codon:yes stop_codon:yes gene_type:complete
MKKISILNTKDKSSSFKRTALFRLKFWTNINSKPSHSSEAFWNRSTDHRIICMAAVNAALNQIPIEYSVSPIRRDVISYESLRRLCRCTDKTMRTIIQEGVDREELKKIKNGRETYIKATNSLVEVFENFEQAWIRLFKSKID